MHAASWRRAYRDALSPEYLEGDIDAERKAFWSERLENAGNELKVVTAESDNEIRGFACVHFDHDPSHGSLLDNLHVSPALKRRGIGRELMRRVARLCEHHATHPGLYLWVLEPNVGAQAFYGALGASRTGTDAWHPPGGGTVGRCRYSWPDVRSLADGSPRG